MSIAMETPQTEQLQCPLCTTSFHNAEHLQRHVSAHESGSSFFCHFCERSFTRRDALNRHWRNCKSRLASGVDIPFFPQRTRGKKRKACDRCVRLKRACNAGLPCDICLSRQKECCYSILKHKTSPSVEETPEDAAISDQQANDLRDLPLLDVDLIAPWTRSDGIHHSLLPSCEPMQDWVEMGLSPTTLSLSYELISNSPHLNSTTCRKFDFLARVTSATGLANSFNCISINQATADGRGHRIGSGAAGFLGHEPSMFHDFEAYLIHPTPGLHRLWQRHQESNAYPACLTEWAAHPLALKTQEIVSRLKKTIRHKPKRSSITFEWSRLVERICFLFFSPPNLCRFLEAFWDSWYPHCPIIHKPTFEPTKTSPILLASMAIIGSCLTGDEQDRENVKMWFDSIEEMVFDEESLQEEYLDGHVGDGGGKTREFEALQAAWFVCLFQNWEGSDITKRRIRRRRYGAVVAVTRDLLPEFTTHQNFASLGHVSQFSWQHFIRTEERIRTFSYVFLLDTAFVIFNNIPPRMFIHELDMHINCPESSFQAESAEDCFLHLKKWSEQIQEHGTFASSIEIICQPSLDIAAKTIYSHFGLLNLFVIISALCVSIYQLQNFLVSPTAFQNIQNGMDNWKDAWDHMQLVNGSSDHNDEKETESTSRMWRRDGFMKSASEYWLLCRVIMDRIQSDSLDGNDLIKPTLGKYDQTDMGQVNDLIAQFNLMSMT